MRRRMQGLSHRHVHMRYKIWVDDMAGTRGKSFKPFLNMRMIFSGTTVDGPIGWLKIRADFRAARSRTVAGEEPRVCMHGGQLGRK